MKSNKILDYILTLTPEQIQKLVDNLPRLYALTKEGTANA